MNLKEDEEVTKSHVD